MSLTPPKSAKVFISHKGETKLYEMRAGLGLQALSARALTPIEYDCKKADCGICVLRVKKGGENLSPPQAAELDFLKAMRAEPDERLACQCRILGDVEIEVEF